jgi:two-component system NtrC family sensor kinase
MTAPPDDTTTDLHAVIAALRAERDAGLAREVTLAEALATRTAELATRNSDYGERIEQQTATIDVLKAMSASPSDAQPVFELVLERARAFCNADYAAAALTQGGMLHLEAASGMPEGDAQGFAAMFPRSVGTDTLLGRAILSGAAMQSADVMADPEHFSHGHAVFPTRSVVAVPLLRDGSAIGALTLARRAEGEFSATQMELLRTFAEQAVIAITSAETYSALQTARAIFRKRWSTGLRRVMC